ncbi:class I SAM-dependent methyltransferase [Rhizohabitans arisaemae]|uniref:class I SAM-dependent methyltransferase n=1 Tax=Rhizohabitans arisaemae TaxID=2720610 RepID=UPI0024B04AE4|nr:class I SAM-dependent methyltransferase [Rhizohabitans arisaemae]
MSALPSAGEPAEEPPDHRRATPRTVTVTMEHGDGMEQLHHPRSARSPERARLVDGLAGRILELGSADGVKLTRYPATVTEIVAVEPDSTLARLAASVAPAATVVLGGFDRLPFPSGGFDAVVCSLVLCTAPRPDLTMREIARVLRPGGSLRLYEHVRSANPVTAFAEDLATPLWWRVSGGCHPNRDTIAAVESAGLVVESLERFRHSHVTHVLGVARR